MTVHVAGRAIPADPRIAWRSVRTEAMTFPRSLWAWLGFLGVLLVVGAVGAVRSLFPGDKGVGTTPSFEWGLLIVGYVFFAITTSGLCLASSLGTVFGIDRFRPLEKRHAILAVLSLVTAFGIIALDLHWPVRLVFGAVLNPSPTSPMWWMGVCYGFYLCVLLTEVWSMFTDHPVIHQYACTAAMCTAIVAPTTLGAVFGVLADRPFWAGPFTPILMVATAFISGTALLGIVFYVVHRLRLAGSERAASTAIPSIRLLLALGLVLVSILVAREVLVGLAGGEPGLRESTLALVSGPLAWQFWGLRVVAGLAVPALLIALPRTRTPEGTAVASALIWVGVFADRMTFVSAGQVAPTTAVSGVVSTPYAAYTPSPVEIAIIVGALGFIAFAYTMAERYLDLREADVHFGFPLARLVPARYRGPAAAPEHVGVVALEPVGAVVLEPSASVAELHVEPVSGERQLDPDAVQPEAPETHAVEAEAAEPTRPALMPEPGPMANEPIANEPEPTERMADEPKALEPEAIEAEALEPEAIEVEALEREAAEAGPLRPEVDALPTAVAPAQALDARGAPTADEQALAG